MRSLIRIVLAIMCIAVTATTSATDGPRDNTAIYSTLEQPLTAEQIQQLAPDVIIKTAGDKIIIILPGVTLTVSSMRGDSLTQHLNGFSGYIYRIGRNSAEASFLLQKLKEITACYGIVIEPGFDSQGHAKTLIMALAKKHDGLIFAHSSVYSPDGKKQLGQPNDPTSYDAP